MQKLRILNSKEKKEILKSLETQFGIEEELDYVFFLNKESRIYIMDNGFADIPVSDFRINSLGLYFGEIYNGEIRLSVDASQLVGRHVKKNFIELSPEDAKRWMAGEDFEVNTQISGFIIVKSNGDFLGCGKISGKRLYNYLPKERRVSSTF